MLGKPTPIDPKPSQESGAECHGGRRSRDDRGTGVAAALMDDGEARLAARGVTTAWLACAIGNDRAARFYEKRGWRRVGVVTSHLTTPDGEFAVDVWRYEKTLTR